MVKCLHFSYAKPVGYFSFRPVNPMPLFPPDLRLHRNNKENDTDLEDADYDEEEEGESFRERVARIKRNQTNKT